MQLVDKGSRGPWLNFDNFALDDASIKEVVDRYISYGFKVEAEGTDFFTQKFQSSDIILIHPHPLMLFNELTHTSHFQCKVVVVLHIWQGYPPYRNFLKGGHLPNFCTNIKVAQIDLRQVPLLQPSHD